ncbi:porin family protein [Chelatococcus sp. SYSU_G07232]|uniref:Porin family protein n=1 Tax=Chelatococcus albus TaxID=3047466 RepID=A0ABT7AHT9_9HYPH|nr:outer membrane protein [Chelatococcus sp. SYSU_G07232]MDJ1158923.1 porin family protein [Chelatococcus sp. SYSU_G07232]
MTFTRPLTLAAAGILAAAQAFAADLPRRTTYVAPAYTPPVFTWTGGYAGLHGGFVQKRATGLKNQNGFAGGAQLGYNYQMGGFVVGGELEASYLGGGKSKRNAASLVSIEQKWLGAAKLRAGVALDRTLIFATAGVATSKFDVQGVGNKDKWKTGYLLGAGVEHAFTDNLTLKAEYNYLRFGDQKVALAGGGVRKSELSDHVVKAGLNYKF